MFLITRSRTIMAEKKSNWPIYFYFSQFHLGDVINSKVFDVSCSTFLYFMLLITSSQISPIRNGKKNLNGRFLSQ